MLNSAPTPSIPANICPDPANPPLPWFEYRTIPDPAGSGETRELRCPVFWSDTAATICAWRYARYTDTIQETDAEQICHRMAVWWAFNAVQQGSLPRYDYDAFVSRITYQLLWQVWAPNSPQWFNAGIAQAYGLTGRARGHYYAEQHGSQATAREDFSIVAATDEYTHPQISACFIQGTGDSLLGHRSIMGLAERETRVFRGGGGSGSNFSAWREEGAPISGGGKSSGLMSFLKIGDAVAGAIKSGGTTRRAAKMVVVDADHPDAMEFIRLKEREEIGVASEVTGRYLLGQIAQLMRKGVNVAAQLVDLGVPPRVVAAMQDHARVGLLGEWEGCTDETFAGYVMAAYGRAEGQNANNSLRVSDGFMRAATHKDAAGREADLLRAAARAAWVSGDPGLQFSTRINDAHTCPRDGEIVASNPCAEYLFLNDTACNLASVNLRHFVRPGAERGLSMANVDYVALQRVIDDMMICLDASVEAAGYPHREIAERSLEYRTVGLGYAALGEVLMESGVRYGSEESIAFVEELTSLVGAYAWQASIRIADSTHPFFGYARNTEPLRDVLATKARRASENKLQSASVWAHVVAQLDAGHGPRNAQCTVIAPTGTIGLLMDCETTGCEPLFAARTVKNLEGGGTFVFEPGCVKRAQERYGKGDFVVGSADVTPLEHCAIVAAAQTYIDGGISKTVNMPRSVSVADIYDIYVAAWRMGVKCVSVYRDGCKLMQPLTAEDAPKCPECGTEHPPIPDGSCAICPACGHRIGGCG